MSKLRFMFLPLALAVLAPISVLADTVVTAGEVVNLSAFTTAGDIVLCTQGTLCSATTPAADIAGVGVFYLSFTGPFTPDIGPANTVTLLGGAQLNFFLTNFPGGFSPNAVFMNVNANGTASFGGFTFDTTKSVATPEPTVLSFLALGLLGLAWKVRPRTTMA